MYLELCDLCHKNEPERRFKIQMSHQWRSYEKICICGDCAEKLFGIKSNHTRLQELSEWLKSTTKSS